MEAKEGEEKRVLIRACESIPENENGAAPVGDVRGPNDCSSG